MEQYTEVTRIGINLIINLGLEFIKIYLLVRILNTLKYLPSLLKCSKEGFVLNLIIYKKKYEIIRA